jgi:glutamine amidotransferase
MSVIIIDYGAGNIQSVRFAIHRLGLEGKLSSDIEEIRKADRLIFPGVGHAESAMVQMKQKGLYVLIPRLTQPVLGICLGMQLMCRSTEEGPTPGMDIFDAEVRRFHDTGLKVPHMGWNRIHAADSPLFEGARDGYIYMVHSYYAALSTDTIATCDYGISYSAALSKDNFYGTQFHPEKSGDVGERVLENFLKRQ